MAIKLTEKQHQILINAIQDRVKDLNGIISPLLLELAEHEAFLLQHNKNLLTTKKNHIVNSNFELLPWSKKIIQVLTEESRFMSSNEIVAEIINRIPGLAEEQSTRSSIASILSRRSGKLFKKLGDKYGLLDWS